ncbi:MAG: WecB/TagA/CpsF family glycosyltransferase [Rubrivivax sp.]|nr:WecB/TagA/CpsF family glycosyltransferase [Rubrivivax sp.]
MTTEALLGYKVYNQGVDECVEEIAQAIDSRNGQTWLACLNPHSYIVAQQDAAFSHALHQAHWLIADGVGVVLASRWLGGAIRERVSGPDVFLRVNERLAQRGARVFFLGASPETLQQIVLKVRHDYPGLVVAGTYSPPYADSFTAEQDRQMIDAVNRAKPDALWIAMTAPKQEKWLAAHRHALAVPFAGAVGAVFDFYTGRVSRSSRHFQRFGLEWLPRLLREPRRLWRRTFVSAPLFLKAVFVARLRGRQRS